MGDFHTILNEFESVVDRVYGIYLDGTQGFGLVRKKMKESQQNNLRTLFKDNDNVNTIEQLDSRTLYYGKGNPNDPDSKVLHKISQGELKARNREKGINFIFLANVCITIIYQYWEDHYRNKLASILDIEPDNILIPIFGDLRLLRRSIIHHRGIALSDVEKCEILTWFSEGDQISIDRSQMEIVIDEIQKAISNLRNKFDD